MPAPTRDEVLAKFRGMIDSNEPIVGGGAGKPVRERVLGVVVRLLLHRLVQQVHDRHDAVGLTPAAAAGPKRASAGLGAAAGVAFVFWKVFRLLYVNLMGQNAAQQSNQVIPGLMENQVFQDVWMQGDDDKNAKRSAAAGGATSAASSAAANASAAA